MEAQLGNLLESFQSLNFDGPSGQFYRSIKLLNPDHEV